MDDAALLALVNSEEERSIGFERDSELTDQLERALEYYKGEMTDLPAFANRSTAVSMDVRDVIQAMLPDVVDVIVGDEEAVSFRPVGPEDEEAAQQETDAIRHVIFQENDGWMLVTSAVLDSFQAKVGVFKWWSEEGALPPAEEFEGKTAIEVQMAAQSGEVLDLKPCDDAELQQQAGEPLYDFKLQAPAEDGKVVIGVVAPEDITVARDTVRIKDATYCAVRMRPRAQDLIAQGIDAEMVESLPPWSQSGDSAVSDARDTVDENTSDFGDSTWTLRQVEVKEHYIRTKDDKGEKLYCVLTGGQGGSTVLLRSEEVSQIQIAAFSPYLVTHRFYGNSVADFVMDIQRVKSQMQRMTLDSGYFALNQRHEVSERDSNESTIDDVLDNSPGSVVRSKTGQAVRPITSPGLSFDALTHLEYFSTVLEERTGLVRGAQGLNPDTLHETKGGMLAQLARSQKRIRMVIKTIVETGIKDLYLGVHATMRQASTKTKMMRLRGQWAPVSPGQWSARNDMVIDIGVGAGGRDYEMAVLQQVINLQAQAVQAQGGIEGPLVTAENLYASAMAFSKKAGIKGADRFFSDPAEAQKAEPQPPPPDPRVLEIQAKTQLEQQKLQLTAQSDAARLQQAQDVAMSQFQLKQQEAAAADALKREQLASELTLKREQLSAELGLKREQMAAELDLKREQMALEAVLRQQIPDGGNMGGGTDIGDVDVGGEPG